MTTDRFLTIAIGQGPHPGAGGPLTSLRAGVRRATSSELRLRLVAHARTD